MPPFNTKQNKRKRLGDQYSGFTPWLMTWRPNNTSLFWMSLCVCCCKAWVLTKTGWELEAHSLDIASVLAAQELTKVLIFFFASWMDWIWPLIPLNGMQSSRLGVSPLHLPSFSLFKYVWQRPNFPLLTPLHFALPCSWTRFQMRNSIPSQSLKEGPSLVENTPINMWALNYCTGAIRYS